ncbi:large ribosomal subunit protein P1-like [Chiloscyllium punctatum]|uniref:large ribosomal subunit protein P1-like n=1 Tax=Chiloscyllium punctatum TaxID=137246 RepID=UPI003B63A17E
MASTSDTSFIENALIQYNDNVTITEDKFNALIKIVGVTVNPFWPSLFSKASANIDISSPLCSVGVVYTAAPVYTEEKKEEKE